MKNLSLLILQLVLSMATLISGTLFARMIFGNGLLELLFSVIFLVYVLLPFFWFADIMDNKIVIDRYFLFAEFLWQILLFAVLFKYNLIVANKTLGVFTALPDVFVAVIAAFSITGIRYGVKNSFFKAGKELRC